MKYVAIYILACMVILPAGCALKEIKSSTKMGPAFKHSGKDRTHSVRWYAIQGYDFKSYDGSSAGITFRRRDTAEGSGNNDSGILFDYSYPVWKKSRKKSRTNSQRVQQLEERLTQLEKNSQTDFRDP